MTDLKILQWNCRSINRNNINLECLLSVNGFVNIIALSETWLHSGQKFSLRGYQIFRQDKINGYGGVALCLSKNLCVSLVPLNNQLQTFSGSIDMVCADLHLPSQLPIRIYSIYCPPQARIPAQFFNELVKEKG